MGPIRSRLLPEVVLWPNSTWSPHRPPISLDFIFKDLVARSCLKQLENENVEKQLHSTLDVQPFCALQKVSYIEQVLNQNIKMECYAAHLRLWRAVIYCGTL